MKFLSRRQFLKTSALAAGTIAFSARSWAQVVGANSDVRVAVLGLNGRGKNHVASLSAIPGVRLVALCDPDSDVLEQAKRLAGIDAGNVKTYTDLRKLFDSSDIDAVTIATPNHWHSLAAIWACQAGKDVYVEKPVSHNVWEGGQLAAAAKKCKRVVQAGVQIRSGEGLREAVEWIRAGNLGKIIASRGLCYKRRDSIGKTSGPQPIPASVNYDLWTGPRPWSRRAAILKRTAPFIMIGIGSGTTAMAMSAIRAFTRWMSPAGFWASRDCRGTVLASAAGWVTWTTAKRPTPRSFSTITRLRR
jgi:hypothetical protein